MLPRQGPLKGKGCLQNHVLPEAASDRVQSHGQLL